MEETPPPQCRGTGTSGWNTTLSSLDARDASVGAHNGLQRSASSGSLHSSSATAGKASSLVGLQAWDELLKDDSVDGLNNLVEALNWQMQLHGRQILRIRGELRSR